MSSQDDLSATSTPPPPLSSSSLSLDSSSSTSSSTIVSTSTSSSTFTKTTIIEDDGASNIIKQQQQQQDEIIVEQGAGGDNTTTSTTTTTTTTTIITPDQQLLLKEQITLKTKWSGKEYDITLSTTSTVADLKRELEVLTNVLSKRQKILGLSKGPLPADNIALSTLNVRPNQSIVMIGTPEALISEGPPPSLVIDVFNDMDYDYIPDSDEISHFEKNKNRLSKTKKKAEIDIINAPRPNKKLLVLDLDHTILDFKDQDVLNMKRPGLEEFLISSYEDYDIAIWSQTSWKWIEIKLTELGLLTNPQFKIGFVLDQTLMFRVTSYRPSPNGKDRTKIKHPVKALDIIWSHKLLGQYYSPQNTLHIDDLSRNFAMNPKNGVHIPAFKRSENKKQPDTVLYNLSKYLKSISSEADVTKINHNVCKYKRRRRRMKFILSLLLLLTVVVNYTTANYSDKCAWWVSNLGNDTADCTYATPCKTLSQGFTTMVNADDSTDCGNSITRLLHIVPDGNYDGFKNVGIRLSYSWNEDKIYEYTMVVQSADRPATAPVSYPLPTATNYAVFDGRKINYLIHFGSIAPITTFTGISFINGRDISTAQNEGAPIVVSSLSTVNFDNCTFSSNTGLLTGAIYFNPHHSCLISNCQFSNNWVSNKTNTSGALFFESPSVVNNTIFTNNTGVNGGAIRTAKGVNVRVVMSTFIQNTAVLGGAVFMRELPLYQNSFWYKNRFIQNRAQYGGAIYDRDSSVDSIELIFDGNVATEAGGAVVLNGSVSTFQNATFQNNQAKSGGAIWSFDPKPMERQSLVSDSFFTNNTALFAGGALYCTNSTARFNVNNTFTSNKADAKNTELEYCSETCLTASRECGCTKGCGLPPPPVKVVTDKTETKITVAVFLPVTAILLGIVAFLLWKTNKKAKFIRSSDPSKYDEIRLTPTHAQREDELQEQL
ncbi:ubiquitin-like domain-containing CTD phosphatase 1 [Cavenderia fasciculata]|uniref:protein-serine/threonine phosphatase n=1 Tax=Cavenderia fasciculata TaxID=261658 RepID=F4QF56_CACFS|nr:ubiquitin-like domain-containing CTD phosphatase 1 [Cavenderia fasciculata]EGG14210.1 ubiquitin-like domain-containing CTD phosphatase 1 [Cavenderia fasciculata]|eukprot:XP_004350918.1 ubiquitin-like domain-containing CTD phosphatase 1 [Cavenderia fasciculata]